MQKDIHFYATYALAKILGIDGSQAEIIAWADQYTDKLRESPPHGLQTQCGVFAKGNWGDPQIQATVLIPFHFMPGDDVTKPWMVTRWSTRCQAMIRFAIESHNPMLLGIALHMAQDTYSHEYFSGWRESLNSCFPWYSPVSILPNIGHAEMQAIPDVVNYVWTDPRNGMKIDNRYRAMDACKITISSIAEMYDIKNASEKWQTIRDQLFMIFSEKSYDNRKWKLQKIAGDETRFSILNAEIEKKNRVEYIKNANAYLAMALGLFQDLPRG